MSARRRYFAETAQTAFVAMLVLCRFVSPATAEDEAPAAWESPRMVWGVPDLQGTWTTATITGLQRMDDVDELVLSPEQARRIEKGSADFMASRGPAAAGIEAEARLALHSLAAQLVGPDGALENLDPTVEDRLGMLTERLRDATGELLSVLELTRSRMIGVDLLQAHANQARILLGQPIAAGPTTTLSVPSPTATNPTSTNPTSRTTLTLSSGN